MLRRYAASARVEVSVAEDLRSTTAIPSFVRCANPHSQPCLRSFYRSIEPITSFRYRPVDDETKPKLPLHEASSSLSIDLDLDHELLKLLSSRHSHGTSLSSSEQSKICVLFMNTTKVVIFGQNLRICFLCGAVARDDRTPHRWELACVA